jgi:capsular exopolysaccharide synthesis family protein
VKLEKVNQEYEAWKKDKSRLFQRDDQGIILQQVQLAKVEDQIFATQDRIGSLNNEVDILTQARQDGVDPDALLILAQQSGNARGLNLGEDDLDVRMRRIEERFQQREEGVMLQDVELALRYGDDHPRRRALQRQLDLTRKIYEEKIAALGQVESEDTTGADTAAKALGDYIQSLQVSVQREQKELKRLQLQRKEISVEAKSLLEDAAKDRYFKDQIARQDVLFNETVAKLSEIDLSEQYGSNERFRIERFSDPGLGLKTDPSLAKSLAGGTMLGFLAGFGLGYLVEMFDKTFRSPQEVSDVLQLPLIGHIPEIIPEKVEGSVLSDTLITAHQPKSPLAENFRAIRTALYFSTAGQQNRVLQTTSPVPGDGKSTLTANLAVTIAQSNKSILVVDADFRRPTQHKLFGLENKIGLSSVVIGHADPMEAAQPTEIPNLHVMSCGPRPHNPSELLTSPQFEELLEVLREQYDFVMIDTPPVLAVTDPGIVSARVDGVIMALRIRKNGRPGTLRARKILQDLDANILGIVVNGIDHRSGAYGYYSNYRRGYGYGNYGGYGDSQEAAEKMIDKYYEEPAEEKLEAR